MARQQRTKEETKDLAGKAWEQVCTAHRSEGRQPPEGNLAVSVLDSGEVLVQNVVMGPDGLTIDVLFSGPLSALKNYAEGMTTLGCHFVAETESDSDSESVADILTGTDG